ncbi:hypothetical protein HDU77_002034 [Chytriomyces hyalinus]|nr:hypothetical protein HDU77_002034 [Chytriomyces hyalinus]
MRENSSRGPRSWSNKIKGLVAPAPKQNASEETLSEDGLGERKRSASESISKWGSKFNLGKKSHDKLETEDVHPVNALEERPARAFAKAEDAAHDTFECNALNGALEDALSVANKVGDMASSGQENIMPPSKLLSKRDSLNSALKMNSTPTKTLNRFPLRSKLTTQRSTEQLSVHKSAIRHQKTEYDFKYGRSSHPKVTFDHTCDSKQAMDQHATAESSPSLVGTSTNDSVSSKTSTTNAPAHPQTALHHPTSNLQMSPSCPHATPNATKTLRSRPPSRIPVPLHSACATSQTPNSQSFNSKETSLKAASLVSLCGSPSRLPVSTRTTSTRTSQSAMDKIASFTVLQTSPFPIQPALSHLQPITVKNHPLERPVDRQLFSDSSQLANGLESDTSGTGNVMRLVSSDAFECMLGPAEGRDEKPRKLVDLMATQPSLHPSHLDAQPHLPTSTQNGDQHSSTKQGSNGLLNGCGNSLAGADPIQTISANIFKVIEPFLKDSEREKQAAAHLLSAQLKDGLAQFELCVAKCRHTSAMVQNIDPGTRNALNTSTSAIKRQGSDLSRPHTSQNKLPKTLKLRLAPGIRYASKPESVSGSSCGRGSVTGCSCNGSEETCTENSEEGSNTGPKCRSDARVEEAKMTSKLALSRYYSSLEAVNAQEQKKLADNAETASSTDTLNKMGWDASSFQTSASAIGRYMEGHLIAKSLAPESGSPATRRKRVGSKKRESNATNIDKGPLVGSDTLDVMRARANSTRSLASNQSMIASAGSLRSRLTSVEPQSE